MSWGWLTLRRPKAKPKICIECKAEHHSECLRTYERCDCGWCALFGEVVVHTDFERAARKPTQE